MFAIEVQTLLNATHALRLPGGTQEALHTHAFQITARLVAEKLDALDTVCDFHLVEKLLMQILRPLQYKVLNDLEPFKTRVNPSAERIAEHIGHELINSLAALPDAGTQNFRLQEIRLTEAPDCLAIWLAS